MGNHPILNNTMTPPNILPTITSSLSLAFLLKYFHMSMEKIELELLYCDVKDDIRAANIAANMMPFMPIYEYMKE